MYRVSLFTMDMIMAKRIPFLEDEPFDLRIKSLADDELLDIWAETQELDRMLREEWNAELEFAPEYERMIVQELQLRSGQKSPHSIHGHL